MLDKMNDAEKAGLFTLLVLALGIGFSLVPGMSSTLYMFTPMLAALLMMLAFTKDGYRKEGWKKLGLHKLGLRGWPFALLVPIAPLALSYLAAWGFGLSEWRVPDKLLGFEWTAAPIVLIVVYIKSVLFESLGEELGWRGYMLPRLMKMGERRATLLNGLVHGVWHAPIILNTSEYHAGENVWVLFPLMLLSTMFLAPVIGRLRLKTGSVWTASMMHTTHNLVWAVLAELWVNRSDAASWISGDMSLVVTLFYMGLTLWMWRKPRASREAQAAQAAA
ncbi:type II CAAX prenyl endopeptidase Rce1 family protein [Cohnella caldifontis]|uniref:CPBP family glutamic-type intramembrane protease n=1 Tax=Cohnella caldifontis TaxID=3027471 RepID=UPI0023EBA276|nr:CPBP family intramembrane glutamic endopeptidase [Cohnella sp. YIM B05605]